MTFAIGHVTGGTNAGRKIQKPAPNAWICDCTGSRDVVRDGVKIGAVPRSYQPAYMSRCPDCRMERP